MADIELVGFGYFKVASIRGVKPTPLQIQEVIRFLFADL